MNTACTRLPLLLLMTWAGLAANAAPASKWLYEDPNLRLQLTARSPDQTAAFYTARKFPPNLVAFLGRQCFLGVSLRNKSDDILWLDLTRWRFIGPEGELTRRDRAWLGPQLDAIDAPPASRATLRWTLLPERLDFHPGEREGGNLLLPPSPDEFVLEASFTTGADHDGPEIVVRIPGLRCLEGSP